MNTISDKGIEKINRIISEKSNKDKVSSRDFIQRDLGLDSLDILELVWELEREFDVVLDKNIFNDIHLTVGGVYSFVANGEKIKG